MGKSSKSQELSNVDVVVLALFFLGGDTEAVDTEDIAMKANQLAPGRFTWTKHPDQVNLEHVRVRLSDAKNNNEDGRVDGGGPAGWHLTAEGTRWARAQRGRLASSLDERKRVDQQSKRRLHLEKTRILGLPAWRKFSSGQSVGRREAEAVFRLNDYVRGPRRRLLIDRVASLLLHDEQLGSFATQMATLASEGQEGSE